MKKNETNDNDLIHTYTLEHLRCLTKEVENKRRCHSIAQAVDVESVVLLELPDFVRAVESVYDAIFD